jgi:branched-chain amino acid transport system substrate-binding protein
MKLGFMRGAALAGAVALIVTGCGSSKSSNSTATTAAPSGSTGTTATGGGGSSSNTSSAPGITPTTIKIGYISSLTGVASSTFADGPDGALAEINAVNAAGGVDGRKIQLVTADDQSSPAGDATAAQDLESKGVFGIIDFSSFTFGGSPTLQKAGIPVTGEDFDGPEWGQEPNSNMFSFLPPTYTTWGGKYYNYDYFGKFLKQVGVTKLAGLSYDDSPSSQSSIKAAFTGGATNGISNCYNNSSVPFGGVDFTSDVLSIKSAGCNGVVGSFVDASDVALSTALGQAGLKTKQLYYTGYDQDTLSSSGAKAAFNGDYFSNDVLFDPTTVPAVATMFANLAKYDPKYKAGDLPDFGAAGSYMAADLMVTGLKDAGQNPTRKSFISNLRTVTSYTAGGLLASPTSFANFGTPAMIPATGCEYFVQLVNGKFVNAAPGGKGAICGSKISFSAGG